MDERAVSADMVSNTTVIVNGAKTIKMKSIGHEKSLCHSLVDGCSDGRKYYTS